MKRFLIISILAAIAAVATAKMPQDYPEEYLGLPGDNFNLYAVMKLFQESETLEGFERSLNDENSRINNLDLNNDNYIDYIKVIDYPDGDDHTIVLQAVLDRNESQDVAVFTVQRFRDGTVQIQLVGDEALYGRNYIIEPYYAETPNPGYTGRARTVVRTTYVEVSAWPVVRYIYMPNYVVWRSSWYWGYYPVYWRPWRPYYWHYYYGYHYHWYPQYYGYYHRNTHHRWDRWNDFYYRDKRVYSRNVTININAGKYRNTYSRPESRSEGEALYAKVHPDRASTITTSRRTNSGVSTRQTAAGQSNGTTRRSDGTVSNSNTRTSPQGTSTTRRQSGSVNSSSGTERSQNQGTANTRRSEGTVNSNRQANPSSGQSTGTVRRPSSPVNEGTRPQSQSGQSAGTVRRTTGSAGEASRPSASENRSSTVSRQPATVNERSRSGSTSTARQGSPAVSRPAAKPAVQSQSSERRSSGSEARPAPSLIPQSSGTSSSARRSSSGSSRETVVRQGSSKSSGSSASGKESEKSSSRRK